MSRRVVIYRLGSLGDTVVALPCLHRIARSFPDAERIVLTNVPVAAKAPPLEAILGGSGLAHRFMAYPVGTRSLAQLLALRRSLRALGAETLVYLTPSRGLAAAWRDFAFFRLCGFKRIVGAPLTADLQHARRGSDGALEMECQRLARCIAALGPLDLDDPAVWNLGIGATESADAAARLAEIASHPCIAVNMGTKFIENDWGESNWTALATLLRGRFPQHALVFIGAAEDAGRAERVGTAWGGAFANLCGQVSPRVSAAAMANCGVFVGHDSGPLHLAACMGVPCVGIYGAKNEPRLWHPYGAQHTIIHEMGGVLATPVERVAQALEATWRRAESLRTAQQGSPGGLDALSA